jgi:hypothetical protein
VRDLGLVVDREVDRPGVNDLDVDDLDVDDLDVDDLEPTA